MCLQAVPLTNLEEFDGRILQAFFLRCQPYFCSEGYDEKVEVLSPRSHASPAEFSRVSFWTARPLPGSSRLRALELQGVSCDATASGIGKRNGGVYLATCLATVGLELRSSTTHQLSASGSLLLRICNKLGRMQAQYRSEARPGQKNSQVAP